MTRAVSRPCLDRRRAGILLHLTSLPGKGPCGDLGPDARRFVDLLAAAGFTVWQTLPVGPTPDDLSPYQSSSVHAGNPRLIALDPLVEAGWLGPEALAPDGFDDKAKTEALRMGWAGFREAATAEDRHLYAAFVAEKSHWLEDFVLFEALREERREPWWEWPDGLLRRDPQALAEARARLSAQLDFLRFEQFLFFRQWDALKAYANGVGVLLFGDMPIFVAHDSAEVWARQELFHLDPHGMPTVVAGVPPDYFSETGQRWGNPLYRWDRMQEDGFGFWIERMKTQLGLFDLVRVDHFRGFESYWEIPASEEYAINGQWVAAPGDELFDRLHEVYDPLPLVAEDLGVITADVEALRRRYGLPGMKILQFAFSGDADNPYLPFRHPPNTVVYTGTHDNDTTLGWYESLDGDSRDYVDEYLGYPGEPMPWALIRAALASRARLAMVPMQDALALDGDHRMNLPGTAADNWGWRFQWSEVDADLAARLHRMLRLYGR
ncbi:MAG: 4-alpha-glucanotransferase [Chromatiales bacterium]|jgi:4-alpha-glucanotransferase